MASAFKSGRSWVARFRRPFALGGKDRRTRRIPVSIAAPGDAGREAAQRHARQIDALVELIEGRRATPEDLDRAVEWGVLDEAERKAVALRLPPPMPKSPRALSLAEAAERHPSTKREADRSPREYRRHSRELREFCEWSRVETLVDLRLDHVVAYIAHLRERGISKAGRRHRLLYLKRAARMGATLGIPDPIGGMVLDRDDEPRRRVTVWSEDELARAAAWLATDDDLRPLACLLLGGYVGMRSSEIARAKVGDIEPGKLAVGEREAKNRSSRRTLPLPPSIERVLIVVANNRSAESPLVAPLTTQRVPKSHHMSASTFGRWLAPHLLRATGRALRPTDLRKSFVTWAIDSALPVELVDQWIGHRVASLSAVTADHYFAAATLRRLRPVAEEIDRRVLTALASVDGAILSTLGATPARD